jgi:hypothetical protein
VAGKVDPQLCAQVAEKIVEAMRATTDLDQVRYLAESLFALKQVESVDNPQTVVQLLKHPLAVMPIQKEAQTKTPIFEQPFARMPIQSDVGKGKKEPQTVMHCLLAYLGRGLQQKPFPDLQSFVDWARAHPEVELDLESPPELRNLNSP